MTMTIAEELKNQDIELENERTPSNQPPPRKKWWRWVVLIAILLFGAYWAMRSLAQNQQRSENRSAAKSGPPSVPVTAEVAKKGDIPIYLNGLGTVTGFNTVTVKTRVDGQLINVAFQEGQLVKKGDRLAEIDPRPFEVQLEQAEGQLARDQAQLSNANVDLARYQTLIQQDAIPKQQLDTQLATVQQLKGAIETDQAAIDNAKLQLTYCHITAPISGRIGLRMVDAGNMVHAADPNGLVVITQVQPISIFFTIPEDSLDPVLKKLRDGDRLPVDAYDRSGASKIASGLLFTVDNQIDQTTGTIRLKAVFDNQDNALFPNQFVNVKLLTDTKKNSILVPVVAIQYGPQGSFAYVVKNDKTVEVRPVTVGTINENMAQIQKGLSAGETVVTDGVDKLRAGSKVVVQGKDQHKGSGHRGNQ